MCYLYDFSNITVLHYKEAVKEVCVWGKQNKPLVAISIWIYAYGIAACVCEIIPNHTLAITIITITTGLEDDPEKMEEFIDELMAEGEDRLWQEEDEEQEE